jgi:hypothetical protein
MFEVIESEVWRSNTGRTASIYGALPWISEAQRISEGWEMVTTGYTVRDTVANTVGIGREPWKTRAEAQAWVDARAEERRAGVEHTAAHCWFVVRKFAYLKSPRYAVEVRNDEGGSSSTGEYRNLRSAAGHIWSNYRDSITVNPSMRLVIDTWHGFGEDHLPVSSQVEINVDAFLARTGVTREAR